MFVKYNNQIHYVTKTVNLITKNENENKNKKRKKNDLSSSTELNNDVELYILFNVNNSQGEFAVYSKECSEVKIPLYGDDYYDFCTIVEREYNKRFNFDHESSVDLNSYFWRVSYKSEKSDTTKTYDIYTIDKIMEDGFLCTLYSSDEIRHFKFKNLFNNRCSDGIISKYFDC